MMDGKTCREVIDLLMDYLEARLPPADRAALDAHLQTCPACVDFLRSYREVPRVMRSAIASRMPQDVAQRLKQFLEEKARFR